MTEEYFDADGFLQTRVVTKQRKVWQWFPDTPYMDVWTGEYDAEGNKVMQTVEGLSDNQLLLAMFLEEAMRAFGIEDAISVAVMVFGQEWVSKAFQWAGATRGTSPLAIALRKIAPYHIMPNWAKAPVGWPKVLGGNGMKMASGKGVGAFAARWLPVGSAVLLAISTGQTFYYTFDHYNEVLESR